MVENLSRTVHTLLWQEPEGAQMEAPQSNHHPFGKPSGGHEGEQDDFQEDMNPFHRKGEVHQQVEV